MAENTLEKQKSLCPLDQSNIKKTAWQENGKRRMQLNVPRIGMDELIDCNQNACEVTSAHERKTRESLEINN